MGEAGGTNISGLSVRTSSGCSSGLLPEQQRCRLDAVRHFLAIGAEAFKYVTVIIVIQRSENSPFNSDLLKNELYLLFYLTRDS